MLTLHQLRLSAVDLIKQTGLAFLLLFLLFNARAAEGSENVTGFAYTDTNFNQIMDANEVGIPDVKVIATDSAGNQIEAMTNVDGSYVLEGLSGEKIKIEFNVLGGEMGYQPIMGSNTLIQFAALEGSEDSIRVDAGFFSVTLFESTYISLVTPCYVAGDPLLDAPADFENRTVGEMEAVVSFPYNGQGAPGDAGYVPPSMVNTMREVGTIWGLAYDRERFKLYQSAFLKRHTGLGELGLGGIYVTDIADGYETAPFIDLTTLGIDVGTIGERDLTYVVGQQNQDAGVFPLVGKVGLGDIDISPDGTRLYIMNLFQKEVIELDLETVSILNQYQIPELECPLGEIRPFALKIDDEDRLWAGAVCSAENGGSRADLSAHIFRLDGGGFTEILSYDLARFNRGLVNGALDEGAWNPWNDTWIANFNSYPVPVLSDIEVDDDGSLIMAFFDRTGHNTGQNQPHPENDEVFNLTSGGEVLRACFVDGSYYIEGTPGLCDYNIVNSNPQGDEYYIGANNDPHYETGLGSLAFLQASGEVAATVYSPIFYSTAGISWLDNVGGDDLRNYQVYGADPIYFGKLNGLGDLEVINTPAPQVLGSRIWLDTNGNGLQDVDEEVLPNVDVELIDLEDGSVLATVTTNQDGRYLFTSGPGVNNQFSRHRLPLVFSNTYAIRIVEGQSLYKSYALTEPNVINEAGDELLHSDGETKDGLYQIMVDMNQFSVVNTSLAFGMVESAAPAGGVGLDSEVGVDVVTDFEENPSAAPESGSEVEAEMSGEGEEPISTEPAVIAAKPNETTAVGELCETCPTAPAGRNPTLFLILGVIGGLVIGVGLGGVAGINLQKRLAKQRDLAK